jgi:hypothetical protein
MEVVVSDYEYAWVAIWQNVIVMQYVYSNGWLFVYCSIQMLVGIGRRR